MKFDTERDPFKVGIQYGNAMYVLIGAKDPDETVGRIAERGLWRKTLLKVFPR